MVIMVDEIRVYPHARGVFRNGSAHLTIDGKTAEHMAELHAFADRLGLRRERFQEHHLAPHYDLTPGKHALAVRLGAAEVSARDQARRRQTCRIGDAL